MTDTIGSDKNVSIFIVTNTYLVGTCSNSNELAYHTLCHCVGSVSCLVGKDASSTHIFQPASHMHMGEAASSLAALSWVQAALL